jgi:anti-anti-sigma factor
MSAKGLLIKEHREGDRVTVSVIGDLLITNADGLKRHLDRAVAGGLHTLTLDMSGVGYIDSFGVGVVVETQSLVDERRGRFRVLVNETISRIFLKSHLNGYVDIAVKNSVSPEPE